MGRVLTLLLLAYVSLDFAIPLMPGAFYFEGGDLVVVTGDRCRDDTPSAICVPEISRPSPAFTVVTALPTLRYGPRVPRSVIPQKRPPSFADRPVPSTEDH